MAIKLAAGDIEADLDRALAAAPDAVVIDGGEGSTHRGADLLIRHLGIPLPHALARARAFLDRQGVDDVTLVATGGILDAADGAKALALGADCLYLGLSVSSVMVGPAALFGLEDWAPPPQLIFADERLRQRFEAEAAARRVANFLAASTQELALVAQATGKYHLGDLGPEDLRALTSQAAESTGVRASFTP